MSIRFELCSDSNLLAQYYELREQCFRRELGLPDFDGGEDERDRTGHILIARRGDRCVGGARIASGAPVSEQLNELDLVEDACCMWERFVIDPEVRTVQLVRDFCAKLIDASRGLDYEFALVLSSLCNARFYRQCHSALGVGFKIHRSTPDMARGAFEGLEHYLSVAHLATSNRLRIAA
ncbi:MAG: hypothetical protein H6985_09700 [Pseudomonadales bacterium]|nr:hypothetical protein [Pseudomonadales bacterium]